MKFPVDYTPCPCRVGVYRCLINEQLIKYEKINPNTHKKIMNAYLSILPTLKKKFKSTKKQNYCKNCGEPASKSHCMTCQLLSKLKK